jgi:hypothetical protein
MSKRYVIQINHLLNKICLNISSRLLEQERKCALYVSWNRLAMSLQMYSCDFGTLNTGQHDTQQWRRAKEINFPYVSLNSKAVAPKMYRKYN